MRLIGLDPGLRSTGWGVIEIDGNRLRHLGNGAVATSPGAETASRLAQLFEGIMAVIDDYQPDEAAVEEIFVNRNPQSALKLGLARGVVLLAPARAGLAVAEYAPNQIKKAVVGSGHAAKQQVALMVATLLPGAAPQSSDAADALAVAICHSHRAMTARRWVRSRVGDDSTSAARGR